MNRRGFLGAILAAGCAPAIVRADALMRIVPRDAVLLPESLTYIDLLRARALMLEAPAPAVLWLPFQLGGFDYWIPVYK